MMTELAATSISVHHPGSKLQGDQDQRMLKQYIKLNIVHQMTRTWIKEVRK